MRAACLKFPLSPSCPCGGCVCFWGAPPPFHLLLLASRCGPALPCLGVHPRYLAARHGRALLGGGSPPSSPPLAAAHVKRARPFWGSPYLVPGSSHDAPWERALPGFVPFLRLPPILSSLLPYGIMAVRTPWVPRVGWIIWVIYEDRKSVVDHPK